MQGSSSRTVRRGVCAGSPFLYAGIKNQGVENRQAQFQAVIVTTWAAVTTSEAWSLKLSSRLSSGMQRVRVRQRFLFVAPSNVKLYDESQGISPWDSIGMRNKNKASLQPSATERGLGEILHA